MAGVEVWQESAEALAGSGSEHLPWSAWCSDCLETVTLAETEADANNAAEAHVCEEG